MRTANERLRAARIAAGFKSARDAAKANGWVESSYRGHEAGPRAVSRDAAIEYAEAYKVSLSWLLTGREDGERHGGDSAVTTRGASLRNERIGLRIVPLLDPWDKEKMREKDYAKVLAESKGEVAIAEPGLSTELRAIRVYDGSMSPRINEGDAVIVDPHAPIEPDRFVVAEVPGYKNQLVRRLEYAADGMVKLIADNPKWGEPLVMKKEDVTLHRVAAIQQLV